MKELSLVKLFEVLDFVLKSQKIKKLYFKRIFEYPWVLTDKIESRVSQHTQVTANRTMEKSDLCRDHKFGQHVPMMTSTELGSSSINQVYK